MKNTKRRYLDPFGKLQGFLGKLSVWISILMVFTAAGQAQDRPNILYIFTDDQSRRSVSAYEQAHPWVKTPNIDKLADSGIRFTTSYTGAWCQPSRASLLTGLFQSNQNSIRIPNYPDCEYDNEVLPFWPERFRKQGYLTACIGKWHLGADVGHGRDWDYSVIWDREGTEENRRAYYDNTLVRYNGGERVPLGGYSTDRYTELAVDYINEQKDTDKPWFMWLCYGGVHGPYTEAERHESEYEDAPEAEVPVDIFGPRPTKPEYLQDLTRWEKDENGNVIQFKNGEKLTFDQRVKKYNRAVASLDDGVGKVMAALKASGQLENTLVVFTSDQGFAWGQHGLNEKWLAYDAAICAPLIFSYQGKIKPNQLCREPVNGMDIARTFHTVAGIEPGWRMDGRDMSKLLNDPQASLAEPLLMINTYHSYGEDFTEILKNKEFEKLERKEVYPWMMMRHDQYKYIRSIKEDCLEELYDLEADPDELNNLAVDREYLALLRRLREQAEKEFRKRDGEFVDFLPDPKEQLLK